MSHFHVSSPRTPQYVIFCPTRGQAWGLLPRSTGYVSRTNVGKVCTVNMTTPNTKYEVMRNKSIHCTSMTWYLTNCHDKSSPPQKHCVEEHVTPTYVCYMCNVVRYFASPSRYPYVRTLVGKRERYLIIVYELRLLLQPLPHRPLLFFWKDDIGDLLAAVLLGWTSPGSDGVTSVVIVVGGRRRRLCCRRRWCS